MKHILLISKPSATRNKCVDFLQNRGFKVTVSPANEIAILYLIKNFSFFAVLCPEQLLSKAQNVLGQSLQNHCADSRIILLRATNGPAPQPAIPLSIDGILHLPLQPLELLRLLESDRPSNTTVNLNEMDLADYLRSLHSNKATKALVVQGKQGKGILILLDGHLHYASYGDLRGDLAVHALIALPSSTCSVRKLKQIPSPNIQQPLEQVLLEYNKMLYDGAAQPLGTETEPDFLLDEESGRQPEPAEPRSSARAFGAKPLALLLGMVLCLGLLVAGGYRLFSLPPSPTARTADTAASRDSLHSPLAKTATTGTQPQEPVHIILRLHGSNTIGSKLAANLAGNYLREVLHARAVEVRQQESPVERMVVGRTDQGVIGIEIAAHGSATAFQDLSSGRCDIGMASRRIKEQESSQLKDHGDMTAPASEHILALDGIAVILNKQNQLTSLSLQQVADIFSGNTTDWSQLTQSGLSGPIQVYARDDRSGTYDTFKSIVLNKTSLTPGAKRFESNPRLSDSVAMDPQGIGFTGLPYIRQAKAISIAATGSTPILPSFFTVATEDYPLARRLYLYLPQDNRNPEAARFIDYSLGTTGQQVVSATGFVDLQIRALATSLDIHDLTIQDQNVFARYLEEIQGKKRLSLNFRFTEGSTILDNRSLRDLDRMVNFLKGHPFDALTLVGFTDNAGDYTTNLHLAEARAVSVDRELKSRGIAATHILSGSEELPVASNEDLRGRQKNRRVEVWIQEYKG